MRVEIDGAYKAGQRNNLQSSIKGRGAKVEIELERRTIAESKSGEAWRKDQGEAPRMQALAQKDEKQ